MRFDDSEQAVRIVPWRSVEGQARPANDQLLSVAGRCDVGLGVADVVGALDIVFTIPRAA